MVETDGKSGGYKWPLVGYLCGTKKCRVHPMNQCLTSVFIPTLHRHRQKEGKKETRMLSNVQTFPPPTQTPLLQPSSKEPARQQFGVGLGCRAVSSACRAHFLSLSEGHLAVSLAHFCPGGRSALLAGLVT